MEKQKNWLQTKLNEIRKERRTRGKREAWKKKKERKRQIEWNQLRSGVAIENNFEYEYFEAYKMKQSK
jgi:hypothetical protein